MSFLLFCSLSDIFHSGQGIQGKKQSPTTWVFLYIFFIENKIFFSRGLYFHKAFYHDDIFWVRYMIGQNF